MELEVPKGRYVIAVSGGVDSMVLLHMLAKSQKPKAKSQKEKSFQLSAFSFELVMAHFNHGIRDDSIEDEKLVAKAAKKYGLPLEIGRAQLGKSANEAKARAARYDFLCEVMENHGAKAIITAHHQDDLIETAFINILRGTGRRGLTAISQNPDILRPLLGFSKKDILKYAKGHRLIWREDESNQDTSYLRNYIRLKVLPKLTATQRRQFLGDINRLNSINPVLDQQIATLSQSIEENNQINRQKFINLPPEIAAEILAYILRKNRVRQFDKKLIDRLCVAIKTAKAGTKHDVMNRATLEVSRQFVLLRTPTLKS